MTSTPVIENPQVRHEAVQLWKELVSIDSGSRCKAGVDRVSAVVARFLRKIGFEVRFHHYEEAGDLLVADYGDCSKPFLALIGHLDTVYAQGECAKRPFAVHEDGTVTGPGCLDMKGGVVVALFALRQAIENGTLHFPVRVVLAGDEEVAHSHSDALHDMTQECRGAFAGFNFETSFPDNKVVLARKGAAQFRIEVDGVGCHVGNAPEEGRSAITEIAAKVADINALTDWNEGTTINVGVIGGGTVANACAEHAWCVVDVRYLRESGYRRVAAGLKALEQKQYVERTVTRVQELFRFPCMERSAASEALLAQVNAIGQGAGFAPLEGITIGGASDSAILAMLSVPVVCSFGVKGRFNHTEREYALLESLFERIALFSEIFLQLKSPN